MKSKKKKKRKEKSNQDLLRDLVPSIHDPHQVTIEDVDNIQGTLNAISSRVDDIWQYIQRVETHITRKMEQAEYNVIRKIEKTRGRKKKL